MPAIKIPSGLETQLCLLGNETLTELLPAMQKYWPEKQAQIVADENTWRAAGKAAFEWMQKNNWPMAKPIIFPGKPTLHADYEHIGKLVPQLRGKAVLAVGSGTINDLVKRASFEAETDGYLCLATAPSVDGYTSAGAALSVAGYKRTVPCPAPLVILADNSVISQAPMDMIAGGYADLAAKIVAGADWHIAATLGQCRYDSIAWNLVQKDLRYWLSDPEKLLVRESGAIQRLFTGLAHTGFAMQYYQDSRPASGAEHLFSHVWEMRGLSYQGQAPSHGFKVAIGTLLSTALLLEMFACPIEEVAAAGQTAELSESARLQQLQREFGGTAFYNEVEKVAMKKFLTGEALKKRRQLILHCWPELSAKVTGQLLDFADLRNRLACLACPVEPEQIGLTRSSFSGAVAAAGMIRQRYTILDLLFESGLLETCLSRVLQKDYFHFRAENSN